MLRRLFSYWNADDADKTQIYADKARRHAGECRYPLFSGGAGQVRNSLNINLCFGLGKNDVFLSKGRCEIIDV